MDGNVSPVGMVGSGSNLFAASVDKVYLSTDNGDTWTSRSSGLPGTNMLSIGAVGGSIVVGTNVFGIYGTTTDGARWSAASGFPSSNNIVWTIVTLGTRPLAGLGGKEYGLQQTTAQPGLPQAPVCLHSVETGARLCAGNGIPAGSYLFILSSIGQFVFAGFNSSGTGAASGIYRASSGGTNRVPVNDGLPNPHSVNCIAVVGTSLYASHLGVWKRPASQVAGVEEIVGDVPGNNCLEQNYPNPFNPTTEIGFHLSTSGFASLMVNDVLGREVAMLLYEELKAGTYSTRFDASGLASGTYFYRLSVVSQTQCDLVPTSQDRQAGSFVDVKELLLLR